MSKHYYQYSKTPLRKGHYPTTYDHINEGDCSSNRESLLVSPHSKPSWLSPKLQDESFGSLEHSLNRYTKPFESPEFLRTDQKATTMKIGFNSTNRGHRDTEPDFNKSKDQKQQVLQQKLKDLIAIIQEKDRRISELQSGLKESRTALKPQQVNFFSPNRSETISFQENKEDRKLESLRKEALFLTQNNLQLFQEVHRLSLMCQQLKEKSETRGGMLKTIGKRLKQVTKQLEQERQKNLILVQEKKEMMKNYEEEIKLFMKMKEVWDQNYGKQDGTVKSARKRSKTYVSSLAARKEDLQI